MQDHCDICGEPIVFRYIGGRPTPIHVNGNWCKGARTTRSSIKRNSLSRPYRIFENYVNPNAYCPVCGETVFYFETSSGSRVFFDDLGWPWPKHPCTDNPRAKKSKIVPTEKAETSTVVPRDKDGNVIDVYEVVEPVRASCTMMTFWITRQNAPKAPIEVKLRLLPSKMTTTRILSHEISEAPALLTRRNRLKPGWVNFWFIRPRSGKIVRIRCLALEIRQPG